MNDITFEQYLGGDPIQILKAAQEKLRLEEEEKKRIAEVEQMKAYRAAALKRAAEEDPLGAAQQMLGQTRGNDPLQQVMQRAAQRTPLDDMAQVSPQEIERQMRERIWGTPAKSKIGKVGKGISDFLGAFSGLPTDFSKPAMEQFLKIQEQYRRERANDLTAMTQAAQITGRENTNKDKLLLDVFKTKHKGPLDFMKAIDSAIKTDAYVDQVNNMDKYLAGKNENEKQRLILEAKKIAADISNEMEYGLRMAELVKTNPQMAALVRANYIDAMQQKAGMNAASKGGGNSRTSTRETLVQGTVIDPATGNQVKRVMSGPQVSTTYSSPPNPVGQAFMAQQPFGPPPAASAAAKSYMSGQTESVPTPKVQTPKSNVTRYSAPDNPVTATVAPKAQQGYTPVSIVKVNPPGMMEFDMGGPATQGSMDKINARKKKVTQISDAANIVMEGYASGVADRVHGFIKQPISGITRGRAILDEVRDRITGSSAGQGAGNAEFNNLLRRFKNDPEAERYVNSLQLLQTMSLADYIQEISGAQSAKEEAQRLSQIFFKMSDQPETVLKMALELAHLTGTAEALIGGGINAQDSMMSSPVRTRLRKEKLTNLENRIREAKLTKMAGGDWKQFMPNAEDFDFNRFLAETEEASGTKFKGVLFQGYDRKPTAREKLKSKVTPEDETDAAFRRALERYRKKKK